MTNQIRFNDVAGFTFQGENLDITCAEDRMRDLMRHFPSFPVPAEFDVHDLVGQYGRAKGVSMYSQHEFGVYDTERYDSGDAPKPFEAGSVDNGDQCDGCGKALI